MRAADGWDNETREVLDSVVDEMATERNGSAQLVVMIWSGEEARHRSCVRSGRGGDRAKHLTDGWMLESVGRSCSRYMSCGVVELSFESGSWCCRSTELTQVGEKEKG